MKRVRFSKGVQLLPSLCTTVSMFLGFFSIVRSINGLHYAAAWAILAASVFDLIDGRIARMTKTQSDFGREYDSLVDLASFGLAPSILVYTWSLAHFKSVGWFFAFLFFACAGLRLARYNVQIDVVEKRRFKGLPTPAAANLVAAFVLLCHAVLGDGMIKSIGPLLIVPSLALLMVSRVAYRSFKEFDVGRTNPFYILIGSAILVGVIAIDPDVTLFIGFAAYAVSGPVEWVIAAARRNRPARVPYRVRRLALIDFSRKSRSRKEPGDSLAPAKPDAR